MNIHIHRNGEQFGPYPEQEVRTYISSGHFSLSDLGWIEGAPDWVPLSALLTSAPPPPIRQSAAPIIQVVSAPPARSATGVCIASWILLSLCCLGALIPGLGFGVWIIGGPVLLVTFILGIVAITRGGTVQGVIILLFTLIVAPVIIIVAPILTTGATLVAANAEKIQAFSGKMTVKGLQLMKPEIDKSLKPEDRQRLAVALSNLNKSADKLTLDQVKELSEMVQNLTKKMNQGKLSESEARGFVDDLTRIQAPPAN